MAPRDEQDKALTIGRSKNCDLVLNNESVSRRHATVEVTDEGFVSIRDLDSSNGTHLHRNGNWVRIRRIILGAGDRVRFGLEEVSLDQLLALYGRHTRVRLREGDVSKPKVVFEKPRRNPLTGNIEEQIN